MPQTVNVPSEITREQLLGVCRSLGLADSLNELVELHIDRDGIRAEVVALDEHGKRYFGGPSRQPATHVIAIPLVDPTE